MKKRSINSNLIRNTLRQYISEQDIPVKDKMVEKKQRCSRKQDICLPSNRKGKLQIRITPKVFQVACTNAGRTHISRLRQGEQPWPQSPRAH